MQQARPKVTVLYHYFHPDDVVSARHYDDFCQGLAARGWQVEAMPCNRGCRDETKVYPLSEEWNGISIRRVWRPKLKQASTLGRIVNASWMIATWASRLAFRSGNGHAKGSPSPDVLVIGTDPIFSVLVARAVKTLRSNVRIVHWCYDLHPEAAVAEGRLSEKSVVVRLLKRLLGTAYQSCDLIADLGSCMRARLEEYAHPARKVTLVPWALTEPSEVLAADQATRKDLFGEASLGLLYSGNFGRAHSHDEFLDLARQLRDQSIEFCFAVRGNQVQELRAAVRPDDTNVRFAGFAPEEQLAKRLGAADIHLVSLRPGWTGLVVPSKFFGCLAAGRPVLFAGSRKAAIAQWIEEYGVGWVLDRESLPEVASELRRLTQAKDELKALQKRCHEVYKTHFCRERIMDRWDNELRALCNGSLSGLAELVTK
jgi:glycosyltransferase involved in cell wall biosynthesis